MKPTNKPLPYIFKFKLSFFSALIFFLLIFISSKAVCQIDIPKWVDDIGSANSNCISSAVKVDKQNNVYVTGFFSGTADFDPSPAVYNLTASGVYDTFVAKYTAAGKFIWAVSVGGSDYTQVNSMTVDKDGNPIISGQYNSPSFDADPGSGTSILSSNGDYDAFVIKLNTNGGFVWAKSIGGGNADYGSHISTDSQGNVIECVRYEGTLSVGNSIFTASGGTFNGLAVKFDSNGNLLWGINIADTGDSEVFTDVDNQGNIIMAGHFQGNDNFNPLGKAYNLNGNGDSEFVAKYTPTGNLIWINTFAGVMVGNNINVCTNSKGDVFVDGPFASALNFGTVSLNPAGSQDICLAKYTSAGSFAYAGDIGLAGGSIYNYGVTASKDDYIYVSGYFSGTIDFDTSPTSKSLVSDHGQQDFFLAKYDANLNYKWAFSGGNASCQQSLGRNVAIDNNNDVLFTGGFCSTVNFSTSSCNPYNLTAQSLSSRDCFVAKYTQNSLSTTAQITAFTVPQQSAPTAIDQNNLKITVTVPFGTDVGALVPSVTYSSNVTLTPASGAAQNFTSPVTYKLSSNCSSLNYTVTVIVANNVVPIPLTVCSGSGTPLTGNVANPVPDSYTWQILQNSKWVNAPGTINKKDYQSTTLVNTTNSNAVYSFRREIIVQGNTSYDSYYDVTVLPVFTNNLITPPTINSFCTTGSPAPITGSNPKGGTGTYAYQWQTSADSVTFTDIAGAVAKDYTPPALTATVYYRRTVTSGACATPLNSNVVSIKILTTPVTPVVVASEKVICAGSPDTLTITSPQKGLVYKWYASAAKTILLFTGTTYITAPIISNTTFYVDAENSACSSPLTNVSIAVASLPDPPVVGSNSATICYGNSGTFTDSTPQNGYFNFYTVATGGVPVASGETFTTPNLTANITYYLESVNNFGCVNPQRTRVDIIVTPLPTAPKVKTPGGVCSGATAVLAITNPQAALTYNWYSTLNGTSPIFTGSTYTTPAIAATISYYVEAVSNGGCTSARTAVPVNVTAPPATPVPTALITSVCTGSSAALSVLNPQANLTYNWYDSAAKTHLLYTGPTYNTATLSANATYYVDAENGTCASPSLANVQVNVTPLPSAPVIINNTPQVCAGSQVTLTISNPQNGLTYNWYTTSTGGKTIATGSSFIINNIAATATYYAEAANSTNCSSTGRASSIVTVLPSPSAPQVPGPATVCSGLPAVINVSNPQTGLNYKWYDAATGGTLLYTGVSFITPAINAAATYYVDATNAAGCLSATRTAVQVTAIQPPPTPVPLLSLPVICSGSATMLSVSNPQPNITYNWYDSITKNNLLYTGPSFTTPALNANTTYYVDAENGSCASASSASVQVRINPQPSAPVIINNTPQVCAGSQVKLNITNPQNGLTYNWYTTAIGGTPVATGSSYILNNIAATVTYYAEAVNSTNCTSAGRTASLITVLPLLYAPQLEIPLPVCSGSTVTLHVVGPQAGIIYNWYNTATGGAMLFSGTSYTTPALTATTTYYADAFNPAGGCASVLRTAVQVSIINAPATPTLVSATPAVCYGANAKLTVANPQTGITYSWYDSAAKTNLLFTGANYVTGPLTANTTFYVQADNGSCAGSAMASVEVKVVAPPTAPAVVSNAVSTCTYNKNVDLVISNPQAGYVYNWYSVSTGGTAVFTGVDFYAPTLQSGTTYYAEATNALGCTSANRTAVNITVLPAPNVTAYNAFVCPGATTAILKAVSNDPNAVISWYADANSSAILATGGTFTVPVSNNNKTYYVAAIDNKTGCFTGRAFAFAVVLPQLAAPIVTVGATTPSSITFNWGAVNGATGYQVSRDNGATFSDPSSGSDGLSDEIAGLQTGQTITIIVRASGDSPCQLSGSSTAVTGEANYPTNDIIYVANAFTPNGDGHNDVVYVHGTTIKSVNFYIYDQWGELLFKSANQAVGWDGTYNGKNQPVGVYVYFLQALMNDGQKINKKGTITLLR